MSNVVPLHTRHLEIDAGVISDAENPADIGQDLFMILLVEADGAYSMLWGGRSRPAASRVAGELAADFGLPLIDKTGGLQ
ncbi:hypothetical protein QO058_09400 [Bosea vestrisii]|uniref:hypothetical protein n=1 Tax=Bosea vestrisii TaxID=151416 RepID=UPI0024DF9981|nr:hypothetical protein [Bosea vestrisii]WID98426.1 hypothetical protein QO058_09400 [Bosea vestrisii]